ncbi:DPP IV N-terminal domain-containing protein [Dyadobacter sp. CY326]|uniref:DPP IV N-terminal domain-containing protein n=1 Tax=Dyadobacter sp. CY326 TaxID=2907300 RepID=UPI001F43F0FA|nr:DPP IV N-terminal domain-containing protein [Dyadobacter sp. CY326]MCE7065198.1 DPP IV N-terminal domain-containing protein [Dyadobacter sp. CY326]
MKKYLLIVCLFWIDFFILQYTDRPAPSSHGHAFPEPSYQLAFAHFGPLNTDIFIANADGSNARPLLPHAALDYNASFSNDGQWVIFTSERNGSADIFRVHPDGTGLEPLISHPSFDDQASISPDGKRIAFLSSRAGNTDIFTLDLVSKKVTNLTHSPGGDFRPAWSADGQWIAFSSDRDSKKPIPDKDFRTLHSTEIYTMRWDGSDLVRRTSQDAFVGSPCWSKDGKQLLVYQTTLEGVRKLTTVQPKLRIGASSEIAIINLSDQSIVPVPADSGAYLSPQWLADGSIAYVRATAPGSIVFGNGHLSLEGEFNHPRWSADGKKMLFHREQQHAWPPMYPLHSNAPQFALLRSGVFPSFSPTAGNLLICNDKTAGALHNQILQINTDGTGKKILFGDSVKSALAPVWSPQGDRIAFGFGNFFQMLKGRATADIAIIDQDGTNLKVLTDGSGNYGFPSWSPDGKKIVYRASTENSKGLFILDVATGKSTILTQDSHDNFPAWSPAGDVIAFTRKAGNNYDIYTIKTDGNQLQRLTTDPGNDAQCSWSPDGKWIAYSTASSGFKDECPLYPFNPQSYGEIGVMRADGSQKMMLTDNQFEEGTIGWMPLGKLLQKTHASRK